MWRVRPSHPVPVCGVTPWCDCWTRACCRVELFPCLRPARIAACLLLHAPSALALLSAARGLTSFASRVVDYLQAQGNKPLPNVAAQPPLRAGGKPEQIGSTWSALAQALLKWSLPRPFGYRRSRLRRAISIATPHAAHTVRPRHSHGRDGAAAGCTVADVELAATQRRIAHRSARQGPSPRFRKDFTCTRSRKVRRCPSLRTVKAVGMTRAYYGSGGSPCSYRCERQLLGCTDAFSHFHRSLVQLASRSWL